MRTFQIVALAFATVSCAYLPPVALDATPADLEGLAGEWEGEYSSAALGRTGTIAFRLDARSDEAFGDVVMTPRGAQRPYVSLPHEESPRAGWPPMSEALTIKFVRANHGAITGMLDRYWDPDRNCFALTTFRGNLAVGTVDGTFTTAFECGTGTATGTWKITRKSRRPIAGS